MSRQFIDLDIADSISGNYEVITDYNGFPGKNLFLRRNNPVKGLLYSGIMHEKFKNDIQYKTMLQRAHGDILYIGMGLGLIAKSMVGIATSQDCVEVEQDIINLCGGVFDNTYLSDRSDYVPVRNYDTIILDCFNGYETNKSDYLSELNSLVVKYEAFLNPGGEVLKYVIGQ
ncbi:MAG: hypothetical protein KAJ19_27485 [Gammaproteobacteria bacterium]|nr:hypothetical protein [Gammaproteobacteria bacterium]